MQFDIIDRKHQKLNKIVAVQECDARDGDQGTKVCNIKSSYQSSVLKLETGKPSVLNNSPTIKSLNA